MSTQANVEAMTPEALQAMVLELQKTVQLQAVSLAQGGKATKERKRIIKVNAKGGLFISDPSFKCWSDAKQKEYIGSINIHAYQLGMFATLLKDDTFRQEIVDYMETMGQAPIESE